MDRTRNPRSWETQGKPKAERRYLRLLRRPAGLFSLAFLILCVVCAIWADAISPYDPNDPGDKDILAALQGPSLKHPLGTDSFGGDVLSALIHGTRVALIVGFSTGLAVPILGAILGAVAAFFGGGMDRFIMFLVDVVMVLPGLPLMLLVATYIGGSYWIVVMLFTFLGWAGVCRMVRGRILSEKAAPYVEAARSYAAPWPLILFRHLLPSTYPLLALTAARTAAGSVLAEAGLSFLGFGDPLAVSWGKMLADAQAQGALLFGAWWWVLFPGLAVTLLSLSFINLGYALEEVFNPRLRYCAHT